MSILGQALLLSGKHDEAIETLRKALAMDASSPPVVGWLGFAYGLAGRPAEARSMLDRLAEMGRTQEVDPYYLALVHVGLGERDRALDYLETAVDLHSGDAFFIRVDPALDPLRQDPRFKALLRRFGAVKAG
jgi:serine/threonine-protein kinase